MKRLLILFSILLFSSQNQAQNETYVTFEFMQVDNSQESFYNETEDFYQKVHEQRIASGDIVGWDLWQLLPGGEDQGYQYLTVTVFDSMSKMLHGGDGFLESAKMAYPDLSDEELDNRLNMAGGSRNLAVRLYLKIIDSTEDDFEMKTGMVATIDLMKVKDGNYQAYEDAESKTFKPWHQKMIDAGVKGNWQLLEVLIPRGTDVYASHVTVNMFSGYDQYLKMWDFDGSVTPDLQKKMDEGIDTRDMRWVYLATLRKMVR